MSDGVIALLMLVAVVGGFLILVLGAASIQKTIREQDRGIAERQADLMYWYQARKPGESFDAFRETIRGVQED